MGEAPATLLTSFDPGVRVHLHRAVDLTPPPVSGGHWDVSVLRGMVSELVGGSDSANVTLAGRLIHQAQTEGDFTAWVATHRDLFFPPDFAAAGIDLAGLPVIRAFVDRAIPERDDPPHPSSVGGRTRSASHAAGAHLREQAAEAARSRAALASRAAERLLRSGAFGLVVIDLARDLALGAAAQGRLLRMAEHHDAVVLILRRKRDDGIYSGSLVTVRAESSCRQVSSGRFRVTLTNTKDKREGPGWTTSEEFDGPPGLY